MSAAKKAKWSADDDADDADLAAMDLDFEDMPDSAEFPMDEEEEAVVNFDQGFVTKILGSSRRPKLDKDEVKPSKNKLVFQQIDIDHYLGKN